MSARRKTRGTRSSEDGTRIAGVAGRFRADVPLFAVPFSRERAAIERLVFVSDVRRGDVMRERQPVGQQQQHAEWADERGNHGVSSKRYGPAALRIALKSALSGCADDA